MNRKCFLILLFTFGLTACTEKYPNDLKIKKLTLVTVESKTGNEIDNARYVDKEGEFYRLELRFTSKEDVWKVSKVNSYVLYVDAFLCENPNLKVMLGPRALYWNDYDIGNELINSDSKIIRGEDGLITYRAQFSIYSPDVFSWKKNPDGSKKKEYNAYDLVKKTESICVILRGRSMFSGVESNVIKVDKKLIEDELFFLLESK